MDPSNPERPAVYAAPVPMPGRCADLPRTLAGADPDAVELVVSSLAEQLTQTGWQTISDTPGSRYYSKNGRMLALDQVIGMVAGGYMTASNWEATCAADGISELMVPVPTPIVVPVGPPTPAGGFQDPFAVAGSGQPPTFSPAPSSGGEGVTLQRIVSAAGVAVVALIAVALSIHNSSVNDHLAGHVQNGYETEIAYDGKLSVNGGRGTSVYATTKHEFETVDTKPPGADYPLVRTSEFNLISSYGGGGRNYIDISHANMRKNLDDPAVLKQWLNGHNLEDSTQGRLVTGTRSTMAGGAAWVWEYTCSDGCWEYSIRTPRGKEVYGVHCQLMAANNTPAARARCKQVAYDLKIYDGHS